MKYYTVPVIEERNYLAYSGSRLSAGGNSGPGSSCHTCQAGNICKYCFESRILLILKMAKIRHHIDKKARCICKIATMFPAHVSMPESLHEESRRLGGIQVSRNHVEGSWPLKADFLSSTSY